MDSKTSPSKTETKKRNVFNQKQPMKKKAYLLSSGRFALSLNTSISFAIFFHTNKTLNIKKKTHYLYKLTLFITNNKLASPIQP